MKFFAKSGFSKLCMAVAFMGCSVTFAADWVEVMPVEAGYELIKKAGSGSEKFAQFGEVVVIQGGEIFNDAANKAEPINSLPVRPGEKLYMITSKDPVILHATFAGARTVFKGNGFIVLLAGETAAMNLISKSSDFTKVELLPENQVILTAPVNTEVKRLKADEAVAKFVDTLDMPAFMSDLTALVNFKTRYTYVTPAQQSIDHCQKVLETLGYQTRQVPFSMGSGNSNNLVAEIKGSDEGKYGQVLVVGHLDSTSRAPKTDAPGADDNGSGSAGVIALARLLKESGIQPAATIKFVLFMGEEQGLYGSKAYVKALSAEEKTQIKAVFNLDMIAFDAVSPLSIMLETTMFNKPMVEKMQELAQSYANFTIQTSFSAHGSDHAPFLSQRVPAVLTIQSEFESNPNYHQVTDRMDIVNEDLCKNILRMNAAALYLYGVIPESRR